MRKSIKRKASTVAEHRRFSQLSARTQSLVVAGEGSESECNNPVDPVGARTESIMDVEKEIESECNSPASPVGWGLTPSEIDREQEYNEPLNAQQQALVDETDQLEENIINEGDYESALAYIDDYIRDNGQNGLSKNTNLSYQQYA